MKNPYTPREIAELRKIVDGDKTAWPRLGGTLRLLDTVEYYADHIQEQRAEIVQHQKRIIEMGDELHAERMDAIQKREDWLEELARVRNVLRQVLKGVRSREGA